MKRIKKLCAFCLLVIAMASCADEVLNLKDPGTPNSSSFFSTEAELEVALVGVYESLNYVNATPFPQVLDHATDLGFSRGNVAETATVTTGGLTSTNNLVRGFWNSFYAGIQRANSLLANMERAEDNSAPVRFEEIRGEALFLRSMFYSYLIELYGDVPFHNEMTVSSQDPLPRMPKAEIVANLLSDLNDAAKVLPLNPAESGRASANAANTLAARIALYNGNYALAAQKAKLVMDSGITLANDYESLFSANGINDSEALLSLQYVTGTKVHGLAVRQGSRFGGWCQFVPTQQTIDTYETINGLPIDEDPSFDPAHPFENRDPRLKASIAVPQEVWSGHVIETHSDSLATWKVENGIKTERVYNPNSTNPAGVSIVDPISGNRYSSGGANRFVSFTGYFWKKFSDEPTLTGETGIWAGVGEHPVIIMRYAEALLTYAEAKIEANQIDQTVLDAINQIRERAYRGSGITYPAVTTTNQSELRRIIRRERKVELADEGFRLFDIRRWRIAEKVLNTIAFGSPANGFSKIGGDLGLTPDIDQDDFATYPGAPSQPRVEKGNLDYRELEVRVFNADRDYLWPIPDAEIQAAQSNGLQMPQNPNY
ncbi:RagB/SusD family nutrient uptake outer membrane protein [uncultured Algibacter sp.]|uniref:RagB/SusD family nutrient uptake outer membrane protein n=1 Tax=uncultured Algibacter sp. TaxID=298659 RepID=UPI002638E372|nr:RagB/SusD family nutrient uptake outer membrane protein [uncultured Algibacter sp.]